MYVTAHCYMTGVRISGPPVEFTLDEMTVRILTDSFDDESALVLEVREPVDPEELSIAAEERDAEGKFLEPMMMKYQAKLHEAASLLEGLITARFKLEQPLPTFNVREINVNVSADTPEEERMLKEGTVTRGFGHIQQPPQRIEIPWHSELLDDVEALRDQIPALSLLAQAVRSRNRGDEELAFVLFFKIIEGYMGDGTARVEDALLTRRGELETYLRYEGDLVAAVSDALQVLNLPTKAADDFDGLISDIVRLRHKLVHFDVEHSRRYFHPRLRFHLKTINTYLRAAALRLIWEHTGKTS